VVMTTTVMITANNRERSRDAMTPLVRAIAPRGCGFHRGRCHMEKIVG
jgi:hypothetical protein